MNKHQTYRVGSRLAQVIAVVASTGFLWAPPTFSTPPPDCENPRVRCVDARPGRADFQSIQTAVDTTGPGDEVVVFAGR